MGELLSLDMSTTATGWAVFDLESKQPKEHGVIRPSMKGVAALQYPVQQLTKMLDIALQIRQLLEARPQVCRIVIEEINKGAKAGRLGQKTLDGLHWIVLNEIKPWLSRVQYRDSDGKTGWRTTLQLFLTASDIDENKKAKALNKKLPRGAKKAVVVTKKHLACRYVNLKYDMALDCEARETDGDIADALGLGCAALNFRFEGIPSGRTKKPTRSRNSK